MLKQTLILTSSLAVFVLLSGCMTPEIAARSTTYDLCRTVITSDRYLGASDREIAMTEIAKRRENCDRYISMIQTEQLQRQALMFSLGTQLINQSQPRVIGPVPPGQNSYDYSPPAPTTPTNCRVIPNIYGDRIQCF
jgi:hypothetical protein